MKTTWLVQTNVPADSPTLHQLRAACAAEALDLVEFSHPPGVQRAPDIPISHANGPIVFHARSPALLGALGTVWSSGVFFSPENFCHRAYVTHYGSQYINHAALQMSWSELLEHTAWSDDHLFIKPIDDFKSFTGHALNASLLPDHFEIHRKRDPRITHATQLVVAPAMEVDAEWRLFIVDGEVVGGSMYRPVGSADVPRQVLDYARALVRTWSPAPVYVLDVGQVEGRLRVIECNCFNASRFYCADVGRIVRAVSRYQEQHFRSR